MASDTSIINPREDAYQQTSVRVQNMSQLLSRQWLPRFDTKQMESKFVEEKIVTPLRRILLKLWLLCTIGWGQNRVIGKGVEWGRVWNGSGHMAIQLF